MSGHEDSGLEQSAPVGPRGGRRRTFAVSAVGLIVVGGAVWFLRPRPDPLILLKQASDEFTEGHLQAAESRLDRRAQLISPSALDWILRARIAEARDRFDEALRLLRHVPDTDPFAAQAWLLAGQVELNRDRARAAETALRKALALDPRQVIARRELIYVTAMQHRREACEAEFRALAELVNLDATLTFLWCQNTCDIWDPYEANTRLGKFVRADPADRDSRLALALSFERTSRYHAAESVLAPLPESDNDARTLRAVLALDRDDPAAAERLAAAGPPDLPELDVLRGRLAFGRKDLDAAVRHFRAALKADPGNRDALHGLGQALRVLGDREGAEHAMEQARRRDALKRMILAARSNIGTDPRLFFKLGAACEAIPLPREAARWYRLAIGKDPLDAEAQQALARLERRS